MRICTASSASTCPSGCSSRSRFLKHTHSAFGVRTCPIYPKDRQDRHCIISRGPSPNFGLFLPTLLHKLVSHKCFPHPPLYVATHTKSTPPPDPTNRCDASRLWFRRAQIRPVPYLPQRRHRPSPSRPLIRPPGFTPASPHYDSSLPPLPRSTPRRLLLHAPRHLLPASPAPPRPTLPLLFPIRPASPAPPCPRPTFTPPHPPYPAPPRLLPHPVPPHTAPPHLYSSPPSLPHPRPTFTPPQPPYPAPPRLRPRPPAPTRAAPIFSSGSRWCSGGVGSIHGFCRVWRRSFRTSRSSSSCTFCAACLFAFSCQFHRVITSS